MRTDLFQRGALRRWMAAGAATVVLAAVAGTAGADQAPSLAQTISYDAAEIFPGDAGSAGQAPLTEAVYSTSVASKTSGLQLVSADGAACESCNGGDADGGGCGNYPYNRCGCSQHLFPYFSGPGACDDWCVGPHWGVSLDALILFRDTINWNSIPPGAGFTPTLLAQFDTAPGARLFVTGYNENRFGMQVGYEGVNDFHANALFTNAGGDSRAITYESRINSVELNFTRRTSSPWRPIAGVRFIELDEDFVDFTTAFQPTLPPVAAPAPTAFISNGRSLLVDNRMIGVQGGAFRDVWRWNKWFTVEPFGNAGVYLNDFRRREITRTVTTVVSADDIDTTANEFSTVTTETKAITTQEFSDLAFAGEAGITGVIRLSPCVAIRGGYQVLVVDRVGQAIDGFLAQGMNGSTLLYHGGHFGVEYVR
jgi:hypothetical protein